MYCSVTGCTNLATKKTTLVAKTPMGQEIKEADLCDHHWEMLNGKNRYSMGCALKDLKD